MSKSATRKSYDYVIVGAGSAGCVLAARLSESDASVLLVEAGPPDSDPNIWSPSGWPALWGTERDYGFHTVPQTNAYGRTLYWPRGRTLGGSSALNGMIYVRGNPTDYDGWANEGCVGWDYASVLPYFKKSEHYEGGRNDYHGSCGPLHVSHIHNRHPVLQAAVQAAVDLGFPLNEDFNGPTQLGVGFADLTVKDGKRHSAAAAFLSLAVERTNLEIITGVQVTRLTFDRKRCSGIEYWSGGVAYHIAAGSEVILAAGTIGSPHLLALSGVGDELELGALGINTVHHLPGVGKNLHDHLLCSVIFESSRDLGVAQNNFLEAQMFWKSAPNLKSPDLEPLFFHSPYYAPGQEGPTNAWTLAGGIIRPTSRGQLRIQSKDPSSPPLLDPNILATDADIAAMECAVRICIDVGEHPTLSHWRKAEVYPGRSVRSRGALHEYIRRSAVTYHHQVGTCKMGIGKDAVVDPELRVHGLEGIRVVDASVMPAITSGNTNAPAIMIAEKAADMIRSAP